MSGLQPWASFVLSHVLHFFNQSNAVILAKPESLYWLLHWPFAFEDSPAPQPFHPSHIQTIDAPIYKKTQKD
jgi:hypothetical protein